MCMPPTPADRLVSGESPLRRLSPTGAQPALAGFRVVADGFSRPAWSAPAKIYVTPQCITPIAKAAILRYNKAVVYNNLPYFGMGGASACVRLVILGYGVSGEVPPQSISSEQNEYAKN